MISLKVCPKSEPGVMLALTPAQAFTPETAAAQTDPVCLDADSAPVFELHGWSRGGDFLPLFTLAVGLESIPVARRALEGGVIALLPQDNTFSEAVGFTRFTLTADDGFGAPKCFVSAPVQVCLPPGEARDNLFAMGQRVSRVSGQLFGGETVLLDEDVLPDDRRRLLEEAASVYEELYGYFREEAHARLRSAVTLQSVEKLRELTPAAAQWIAAHPGELQPVPRGQGLRARGRSWLPAHVPVRTVSATHDTPENRAVVGFAAFLSAQARTLAAGHPSEEAASAGAMSLGAVTAASVQAQTAAKYLAAAKRLASVTREYAAAMTVTPVPVQRRPEATPVFLGIAQYRRLYALMTEWFALQGAEAPAAAKRLTNLTGSRLYEYFTLVSLLDGFIRLGFSLTEALSHPWTTAGKSYEKQAKASLLNTFTFTREAVGNDGAPAVETLRLWYQPVIAGQQYTGENHFRLYRRTSWSMSTEPGSFSGSLTSCGEAWYTPDFAVSLERGGKTVWALADSKYAGLDRVKANYAMSQVFKYIVSVAPADPHDDFAGLWLFCGKTGKAKTCEGSFFDVELSPGTVIGPDMVFARLNALEPETDRAAEMLLNALAARFPAS